MTEHATHPVLNPADLAQALVELLTVGQHFDAAAPAVLTAVGAERQRQRAKHGPHAPDSPSMSNHQRLVVLMEEVGEVARALTHDGNPAELCAELDQVAAIALGWREALTDDTAEPAPAGEEREWAVRDPELLVLVHRSREAALRALSSMPGAELVTRRKGERTWTAAPTGEHGNAATPAVLAEVGRARREASALRRLLHHRPRTDSDWLLMLTAQLGEMTRLHRGDCTPEFRRSALATLVALGLAWLETTAEKTPQQDLPTHEPSREAETF
ncbi:hypothetical protein N8J89_12865 [Crossiella sp. CA-258035]|uniref:hypothetical protein n=1 Tax=Crossiella sp. CA-258035 TaxID=2981138 RepID=UPI0024BCF1F5|nr:hypothetical protein [Crossiella sp. CA-258035]WHT21912.1 hypothetical protein N8J89_12865 [Crossiella sp. CA-258035]